MCGEKKKSTVRKLWEGPVDREQEKSNTNTTDGFVCLYLREKADMKENDKSAKQDEDRRKMEEEMVGVGGAEAGPS